MLSITPLQAAAVIQTLAFFQGLVRPGGPAFDPMLVVNWAKAGEEVGLRGNPQNPKNSLVRQSRLLQVTSPTGETSLGLLLMYQPDYDSGELYLAPYGRSLQAAFRLEMPSVFRAYKHCTDPLTDDTLTFLKVYAVGPEGRIHTRNLVRLKDLWKSSEATIDHRRIEDIASRPAEIAAMGALQVSRAFDASDLRWAPSPWARFILNDQGLEGVLAAKTLGMNWMVAEEDRTVPPGSVFSHGPL